MQNSFPPNVNSEFNVMIAFLSFFSFIHRVRCLFYAFLVRKKIYSVSTNYKICIRGSKIMSIIIKKSLYQVMISHSMVIFHTIELKNVSHNFLEHMHFSREKSNGTFHTPFFYLRNCFK